VPADLDAEGRESPAFADPAAEGRFAGVFGGGGLLLAGAPPVRQALFGVVLAVGTVVVLLVVFYVILVLRWLLGVSEAPGLAGIFGFVAAHGGAISVEAPPTPALMGLGGSLTVDPPLTTLALLPFLVLLAGSWAVSRMMQTSLVFVGVVGATYAVLLTLLALLGRASTAAGDGAEISISASPLSAALHGLLIAALGALVGVVAARGPLLPDRARQIVKGAFAAVLISVVLTVLLAGILALVTSIPENPLQDFTQGAGQAPANEPSADTGGFGGLLASIGTFVALLPAGIGTLWLLAHGIPVGLQNVPDLGSVPIVGAALQEATLSASLISNWPFAAAWRLLLIAPIVGLVLGGAVAARGAPASRRLLHGALVCVPYAIIVLLTAVLMRLGLSVSASGLTFDAAFGAALVPTLLVLPGAALLGAGGALLARPGAIPVPRPRLVGIGTAAASVLLLIGTLPLIAASPPEAPAAPNIAAETPGALPGETTVPEVTVPEGTGAQPEPSAPEQPEDQSDSPGQSGPSDPSDPASSPEGQFISTYYAAAAREDWVGTYELLASGSQDEFTQEEWVSKQQAFMANGAPRVQSAEVTAVTSQGSESVVTVEVTYEDGSQRVLTAVELVSEDGELRRRLTDQEIANVRAVPT
jgi:hypothetical protein